MLTADEHSIEGSALNRFALTQKAAPSLALSVILLAGLTACGGGAGTADPTAQSSAVAAPDTPRSASTSAASGAASSLDSSVVTAMAQTEVVPSYHLAPALLDEPAQADAGGTNASARRTPKSFRVEADAAGLDTARLSRDVVSQRLSGASRMQIASTGSDTTTAPQATTIIGAVHTPAQIRAAYGLAALPAAGTTITPEVAATLGAGQTIYIVDAYHDASALSDLNAFSTKFGLPTCSSVAITSNAKLAAAPASCTFSQVYSSTNGAVTTAAPLVDE